MRKTKVLIQNAVSADRRAIAQAISMVSIDSNCETVVHQGVTVQVSSGDSGSTSFSSAATCSERNEDR